MSRDYKLNKSELTRIKREEKQFLQFLPVLKLKQEQLQIEQNRIKKDLEEALLKREEEYGQIKPFVKFFCDKTGINISDLATVSQVKTYNKSIAGVQIKTLESISFKQVQLPVFQSAPWLLKAVSIVHRYLHVEAHLCLLEEEHIIIKAELRKATKKVNLFDMVLIPKAKSAIKRIKIALQDEQVASVSRGKIAKLKKPQELAWA